MNFLICSQLKIISTAFFSRVLLETRISRRQTIALIFLIVGIILVQTPNGGVEGAKQQLIGVFAVCIASISSGFAGIFLEKVYKSETHTLLEKNLKLGAHALPVVTCMMMFEVGVSHQQMFQGFDIVVMTVVVVNAIGGLIISAIMTYASSILKCFAIGASICSVSLISALFGHKVTLMQILGVLMVSGAVGMYSY